MRTRPMALVVGIGLLLANAPLSGQQTPLRVRRGQRVRVVTAGAEGRPDRHRTGKLLRVSSDTAVVQFGSGWFVAAETLAVALAGPQAVEVSRNRHGPGVWAVAIGGAVLGGKIAARVDESEPGFTPSVRSYVVGLAGAAVGVAAGLALFPERWERLTSDRVRVGVGPAASPPPFR